MIPDSPSPRLSRLLGFLDVDPLNEALLADAATLAFEERRLDLASTLIARAADIAPLRPAMLNVKGLVAIAAQRFEEAIAIFEQLVGGSGDPALRFNLAWANALVDRYERVDDLLDDEAIAASPRGPALKIRAMHHLERFEEALATGRELAERFPDDAALMGAMATLAMDADEIGIARHYAERAGDDPEGLAARGLLALDERDAAGSLALFEQAIARQQHNPRAWVGRGLSLLAARDVTGAADSIDRGARLFEDHIGSWIASGWAHFLGGEHAKARTSFEQALALDGNFAESHGGLAVLDVVDRRFESAERRCEIALRLDRNCFGAALAKILLLQGRGDDQAARRIRDIALSTPIGPEGRTIADALIGSARTL